ncbi:LamG domain-containing protein [Rubinisphaera brasiliensis]|nr:LamG domain-containing protein [Rubinisphaera brasiliensis]
MKAYKKFLASWGAAETGQSVIVSALSTLTASDPHEYRDSSGIGQPTGSPIVGIDGLIVTRHVGLKFATTTAAVDSATLSLNTFSTVGGYVDIEIVGVSGAALTSEDFYIDYADEHHTTSSETLTFTGAASVDVTAIVNELAGAGEVTDIYLAILCRGTTPDGYYAVINPSTTTLTLNASEGGGAGYGYGYCPESSQAELIIVPSADDHNVDSTNFLDFAGVHSPVLVNADATAAWINEASHNGVRAIQFDGTDDVINVPTTSMTVTSAPLTICMWAKADSLSSKHVLFAKKDEYEFYFQYGDIRFRYFEQGSSDFAGRFHDFTNDGSAHHLAVTWGGSGNDDNSIQFFVDGTYQDNSGPFSVGSVSLLGNAGYDVTIGANWDGTSVSDAFDGWMDDIRFYKTVLTTDEISTLAEERRACFPETGGVVAGGLSQVWRTIPEQMEGGVTTAGEALFGVQMNPLAGGGTVAGGDSDNTKIVTLQTAGGVVAGGVSQTRTYLSEVVSGGLVAGGESDVSITLTLTGGGVLVGGGALLNSTTTATGSGGVVSGGSAQISTNITECASGGVVVVQPVFANGYAYRLPLTIPAEKVSSDLFNFPVGVVLQLSSSDFIITDSMGNVLDYEIRDQDDDLYWLFFKAALSSSQDNEFFVYFGGGE